MHAASRSALAACVDKLGEILSSADNAVAVAAQTGTDLFDCVDVLDAHRALRVAVAESSSTGEQRAHLVRDLFGGKIAEESLAMLTFAVSQVWSTPKQQREGLIEIAHRSLLQAAVAQDQLHTVEDELFELSRLLRHHPELTQLLSDRTATPVQKRSLFATVLYGKVSSITEILALHAVGRPVRNPVDDLAALSSLAASLQGKTVATVITAQTLNDVQRRLLTDKLARIYHTDIIAHTEVDPSLLGGMIVHVGDEVIDGSTASRIAALKAQVA